jgi:hypothetical protein
MRGSRVTVGVIRTDEELMITKTVCSVLGLALRKETFYEEETD